MAMNMVELRIFSLFFPWIICVNGGGRKNDIKIRWLLIVLFLKHDWSAVWFWLSYLVISFKEQMKLGVAFWPVHFHPVTVMTRCM
jgi:hypothetical protein